MPSNWTMEQVLALAPDAASAKAGRDLAAARKWVSFGGNGAAVWGECQGSGANPYQTRVDLGEPAYKCSCPSRKFPCKHSLGLLFLFVAQPTDFDGKPVPDWVQGWLDTRAKKAEEKTRKQDATTIAKAAPPDPVAQAKRAAKREANVAAGLADLDLWLRDVMRQGLAAVRERGYAFWDDPAARMVDAQASGIARMLREMAGISSSGPGWEHRLLDRIGKLHLLVEGYKRLDTLPDEARAEIRSRIGWTQNQDELLESGTVVSDRWTVLGQSVEEEERLRVQRTWLVGQSTRRFALILAFAVGPAQALDKSLLPGTTVAADLVFFPGIAPVRALVKARDAEAESAGRPAGGSTITAAMAAYGDTLAVNPWLEQFPVILDAVTLHPAEGEGWFCRDAAGHVLPFARRFVNGWRMLAASGGHPSTIFGEWNGFDFTPRGMWTHAGEFLNW